VIARAHSLTMPPTSTIKSQNTRVYPPYREPRTHCELTHKRAARPLDQRGDARWMLMGCGTPSGQPSQWNFWTPGEGTASDTTGTCVTDYRQGGAYSARWTVRTWQTPDPLPVDAEIGVFTLPVNSTPSGFGAPSIRCQSPTVAQGCQVEAARGMTVPQVCTRATHKQDFGCTSCTSVFDKLATSLSDDVSELLCAQGIHVCFVRLMLAQSNSLTSTLCTCLPWIEQVMSYVGGQFQLYAPNYTGTHVYDATPGTMCGMTADETVRGATQWWYRYNSLTSP